VFVYQNGQIVLRFGGTGNDDLTYPNLSHRYLWGPTVDFLLADEQIDWTDKYADGEILWMLTDHLGTVRDVVDNDGDLRHHNGFDSFGRLEFSAYYDAEGEPIEGMEPWTHGDAVHQHFFFTGRYLDPLTGLQYNDARWYNSEIGRWMSEDPIGFAARDANLSRYVGNEATMFVDPDGLAKKTIGTGVRGYTLFLEWFPDRYTGELKVLRGKEEMAIIKYMLNPKTGEGVCETVVRHGGKTLPGIASSKLKKLAPQIRDAMDRIVVRRTGGEWVISRIGRRIGLGTAGKGMGTGVGAGLAAFLTVLTDANTCDAAEVHPPIILTQIDPRELGLSDSDIDLIIEYSKEPWRLEPPPTLEDIIRELPPFVGTPGRQAPGQQWRSHFN